MGNFSKKVERTIFFEKTIQFIDVLVGRFFFGAGFGVQLLSTMEVFVRSFGVLSCVRLQLQSS